MQEDIENRTLTMVVNSSKFTGRTLYNATKRMLSYVKHKAQSHHDVKPRGKQSVKKLVGQDTGVSNADLGEDASFRMFDQIAKKYGVDYAVKRIQKDGKTQHLIFFKARDADAIYAAMSEYTTRWLKRSKENKPSLAAILNELRSYIGNEAKARAKDKEISR